LKVYARYAIKFEIYVKYVKKNSEPNIQMYHVKYLASYYKVIFNQQRMLLFNLL